MQGILYYFIILFSSVAYAQRIFTGIGITNPPRLNINNKPQPNSSFFTIPLQSDPGASYLDRQLPSVRLSVSTCPDNGRGKGYQLFPRPCSVMTTEAGQLLFQNGLGSSWVFFYLSSLLLSPSGYYSAIVLRDLLEQTNVSIYLLCPQSFDKIKQQKP